MKIGIVSVLWSFVNNTPIPITAKRKSCVMDLIPTGPEIKMV